MQKGCGACARPWLLFRGRSSRVFKSSAFVYAVSKISLHSQNAFIRSLAFPFSHPVTLTLETVKHIIIVSTSHPTQKIHQMAHSNAKNPYRSGRIIHLSSTPKWTVFFVQVLFILLLLLLLPQFVDGSKTKKIKQSLQVLRSQCREQICSTLPFEESMNCVHFCTSPACYESVYGDLPLEDGEMDTRRERSYEECVQKQLDTKRRQQRVLPRVVE